MARGCRRQPVLPLKVWLAPNWWPISWIDVVDVERVADRVRRAGHAAGLEAVDADDAQAGDAAAAGAEDVADVVVGVADDRVAGRLVLASIALPSLFVYGSVPALV